MLHSIVLNRYYPIRSKIHAMNPVSKLLCILIFIVMTFLATTWQLNILLIILTLLFLLLTNIPMIHYFRTVKVFIPIYIVILIIGFLLHVSLIDNLLLMARITLIFFYFIMLTLTTPMTEIIYGFEKIFCFLKVFGINVSALALSITEAIRFFPNLLTEEKRILKSAASRGIDYRHSNFFTKIFILTSMLVSTIELSIQKSEDLKSAMMLRLYQNGKRTNFRMNCWKTFDSYMVMIYILVLFVIIKKGLIG